MILNGIDFETYFNNYPDKNGYRRIYYYDIQTDESIILLQSYSPFAEGLVDIRTDLHNRWNNQIYTKL